jgi:hypothetical protein
MNTNYRLTQCRNTKHLFPQSQNTNIVSHDAETPPSSPNIPVEILEKHGEIRIIHTNVVYHKIETLNIVSHHDDIKENLQRVIR